MPLWRCKKYTVIFTKSYNLIYNNGLYQLSFYSLQVEVCNKLYSLLQVIA
jgi:hypothetical protein